MTANCNLDELARRAAATDQEAFDKLVREVTPKLFDFFHHRGVSVHHAEDLAQAVWIRIVENIRKYDSSRSFMSWVRTIARNSLIDHWRKTQKQVQVREILEVLVDPVDRLETEEEELRLSGCIEKLPSEYRRIIVLRFTQGLDLTEVAVELGQPYGSVRAKCHRAVENLRRCMTT